MRALVWITVALAVTCLVLVAVVCATCASLFRRAYDFEHVDSVRMTRVDDADTAALLVAVRVGTYETFFQLDTGYAGAPLFSAKHLVVERVGGKVPPVDTDDLAMAYRDRVERMREVASPRMGDLRETLRKNGCEAFTAGCSMDAISIGMVEHRHNELLNCPSMHLQLDGPSKRFACPMKNSSLLGSDVMMVSNITGPHIITMDWMFQFSPCVMWMRDQKLEFPRGPRADWLRKSFSCRRIRLSGGAPVMKINVGNRRMLKILIDTGAATGLTLDRKYEDLVQKIDRKLSMKGSAGETVCGDLGRVSFGLAAEKLTVPVTLANVGDDEIDGFCGLHILKAFDLYLSEREIGFKRNGLEITHAASSEEGRCAEERLQSRAVHAEVSKTEAGRSASSRRSHVSERKKSGRSAPPWDSRA